MSPYRVTVFGMLKGGVRKTTSTMFTALALARRGVNVLVIDADTGTQGATAWATQVYADGGELPFDLVQWSADQGIIVPWVQRQARQSGASLVLVDVGGEQPHVLEQLAMMADRVIMPVGPEPAEVERLGPTMSVLRKASPTLDVAVLMTRVHRGGIGASRQLRDVLTADGYTVLPVEIPHHRARYADTYGTVPADLGDYDQVAAILAGRTGAEVPA